MSSIRATLDANGLPYSVLVYGILAALQALHAARLTGTRAGTGWGPASPEDGDGMWRGQDGSTWVNSLDDLEGLPESFGRPQNHCVLQ